ncbi:hypothetical protein [Tunicatimonas pelagia]|uniref:hypothetical protein n=1 Tax=Tunicatimonas pelagia TaxID=931531 RepID=UPI002665D138|nr:hypothetical protein [Tunicatimonas pelagia]WKN44424.1 hypothetical protein P0M28_05530 [Tunicatimonas pelagia]
MNTSLFNWAAFRWAAFRFAKLFAFALLVIFSACTQSEDPVPTTPDNQNPNPGLPDLGGGGSTPGSLPTTPGGGSNPTTPGGGNPTTPGGGQTNQAVGVITFDNGSYEFPFYLGAETEAQPNETGAYLTEYYYADEAASQDNDGDDNIEGVITAIAFNATNPGTISPGQYPYTLGSSDAQTFPYIMVIDRGRIFLVAEAQTQIGTTSENSVYQVTFDGQAVEVELVNGELSIISNPFNLQGQFFIPATVSNSSAARYESKPSLPSFNLDFSNLSF